MLEANISRVKQALQQLEEALKTAAVRSKGLENCWRRTGQLIERFNLLTGKTPDNTIHWFETHTQSFTLQLTPMVVASDFKRYIEERKRTWIFTSATLTVKNNFQLFVDALGLNKASAITIKKPI